MPDEAPIIFIDPDTGTEVKVRPVPHVITAAFKLGYVPATTEATEACDRIQGLV